MDPCTPVIVGAAQITEDSADDGPIALAARALRAAADDAGTAGGALLRRADSARHVSTICWPYSDEAALIAASLGATPRETVRTAQFGGDGPGRLVADTARAIAAGELSVALISGAEAVGALRVAQREGRTPDWPSQRNDAKPTRTIGTDRFASNVAETAVGLLAPVYNYALLETAVQGARGAARSDHARAIAELWACFSAVAAENPHARIRRRYTADELLEVSARQPPGVGAVHEAPDREHRGRPGDRADHVQRRGRSGRRRPPERWVFPLAGAYAADEWFMTERASLAASPAIAAIGEAALGHTGASIDDVAYIDLYSCFPSAVQIACSELGLDMLDRTPTLTGGLTFAGGPGNNYASHGIAAAVARLREDPEAVALTTALGWYATKHAMLVFSGRPGERPFAEIDAGPLVAQPAPRVARADYAGPGTVEA